MTHIPFDVVGFDLDGTLVDTAGDLAHAVNRVLDDLGRPPRTRAQVVATIGGGARAMLRQTLEQTGGLPDAFEPVFDRFLGYYGDRIAVDSVPYEGMTAALDQLAAAGVRLAVGTNKPVALAERLLEALGLRERFAVVLGGDSLKAGLAKPNRGAIDALVAACGGGRAAFVGDSPYDVQAARGAGVPVVAVRFGYGGDVDAMGADAVIDRYDELLPALERLGSSRA